jgi:hypothetical protein
VGAPVVGIRARGAHRLPAPEAEERPESLAAAEKIPGERFNRGEFIGYGDENGGTRIEESIDSGLDQVDEPNAF